MRIERGLALLDTDMLQQGQDEVQAGLQYAWPCSDVRGQSLQQAAANALGALWCERGDFTQALEHLRHAQQLYQGMKSLLQQQQMRKEKHAPLVHVRTYSDSEQHDQQQEPLQPRDPVLQAPSPDDVAAAEAAYTATLYYLAQVHGHAGDKARSAVFCAATLNRQLHAGGYSTSDWLHNCLQLSGYFCSVAAFGPSLLCLLAVDALATREAAAAAAGKPGAAAAGKTAAAAADGGAASAADNSMAAAVDGTAAAAVDGTVAAAGAAPTPPECGGAQHACGAGDRPEPAPRPRMPGTGGSEGCAASADAMSAAAAAAAALESGQAGDGVEGCSRSSCAQGSSGEEGSCGRAAADGGAGGGGAAAEDGSGADAPGAGCGAGSDGAGRGGVAGGGSTDGGADASGCYAGLDADAAANCHQAWGKHYLQRLLASHQAALEGLELEPPDLEALSAAEGVPGALRFDTLPGLPSPDKLPTSCTGLVSDFDGARRLYLAALPRLRAALAHYALDGWVTDHVSLLMELSNLNRLLAGFEPDPHRRCVIHTKRAKLLEPLVGALSPAAYPGLSRSISLELGNIYREVHEIKEEAGWPEAKVAVAGAAAARHYRAFLASLHVNGQLPSRLDPDSEQYCLSACFSLGRVLHKPGVDTDADRGLVESARYLLWLAEYVRRHDITEWKQEACLAEELASLVAQKLQLLRECRSL